MCVRQGISILAWELYTQCYIHTTKHRTKHQRTDRLLLVLSTFLLAQKRDFGTAEGGTGSIASHIEGYRHIVRCYVGVVVGGMGLGVTTVRLMGFGGLRLDKAE